ncbi:coiled-coil domain-containing protein 22 homolog [Epargyreus clarus]|uniref:coiled-coil domain-containing protein 22 homolog n=1 Tax=Epargyreus clarus TaxID=520877 RepID=UPI003C2F880D
MEEVDSIIFHFLRQLNIDISSDIKNICDLPVERIIESASRCISAINSNLKVPTKLPPGVSQRIEVAAQIASICKDLGYKNDVGYQTFLYYNEAELRQVFMFLIEKLPTEDKHVTSRVSPTNKKQMLMRDISLKIETELNSIWIPPCCVTNQKRVGDFAYNLDCTKQNEINEEEVIKKIQKISNIIKTAKTVDAPQVNNEKLEIVTEPKKEIFQTNKTLKELKETTIVLKQKLDTLESERNVMDVEYCQAQKNCERSEADFKNVVNILNNIGITELEDDVPTDNIIGKVHKTINNLHRQCEEWTSKNLALKVEIDKIKTSKSLSESERNKCRKILLDLKETVKSMKQECEKKEELKNQLKIRFEKLKGGNRRHIYTKRILEIIGNVEKQNMEIRKILEDTRKLQKEINTLEGQLNRCFSIADETLFKDAKKDDQAKKAYKLLALLHSECNTIVSLVNDTGMLARDVVDLEDNIKAEKSKKTEDILQKIQLDLAKIQNEA